eukprot:g10134.t1
MVVLFLLLLVSPLLNSAEGFLIPSRLSGNYGWWQHAGAQHQHDKLNNFQLGAGDDSSSIFLGDDATLVSTNGTLGVDATTLAESKQSPSPFQIQRPRWYNKNEVAIIVLLCKRLNMLDLKGVEHMLDAQKNFAKQDPRDVWERALFIKTAAPGANFRTVIQRHPRTLMVPVHRMQAVLKVIREAYPNANIARVVERVPSVLSRNATRLEGNIAGLKKYAPEVDSNIFQSAPSMAFLPPNTVKEKVAALRACLPGVNLYNFLKGMPTALCRSKETVPRGVGQLKERFPTASLKELVRIVESAPSLIRMSGANGSLSIKVDNLMALLPGVNVTNVISNAPGVLIRGTGSLPAKVSKLNDLFPTANVTKMVSRTPGIMYLDIDRTVRPKAMWIQKSVGLDQDELDRLVEKAPWMLKAGWGPLNRVEFAMEAGIATKDSPSSIFSLVRSSRLAFARKHHLAYSGYLRRKLEEEDLELRGAGEGKEGREGGGDEALHPLAWSPSAVNLDAGMEFRPRESESVSHLGKAATGKRMRTRTRTAKLESAGEKLQNVISTLGDEGEEEEDLVERAALEVAELEDRLGRGRKARLAGVKDRPPKLPQPLARLQGSSRAGDALLDLGQEEIVAKKCAHKGCAKQPSFGVAGSTKREFCSGHAKGGMVTKSTIGEGRLEEPGQTNSKACQPRLPMVTSAGQGQDPRVGVLQDPAVIAGSYPPRQDLPGD